MTDRTRSNLNIKQRKKQTTKKRSLATSRRKANDEKVKGANIIFGLDNGATGTIACIVNYNNNFEIFFEKTPSNLVMDYQQEIQYIARIDWKKLKNWFEKIINLTKDNYIKKYNIIETDIKISDRKSVV